LTPDAKPEDENARLALEDPQYYEKMVKFGEEIHQLTESWWKEKLVQNSQPDQPAKEAQHLNSSSN